MLGEKKAELALPEGLLSCGADVQNRDNTKVQTPYIACTGEVLRVGDAHYSPS